MKKILLIITLLLFVSCIPKKGMYQGKVAYNYPNKIGIIISFDCFTDTLVINKNSSDMDMKLIDIVDSLGKDDVVLLSFQKEKVIDIKKRDKIK